MVLDYTKAGNYRPPTIQSKVPSQQYKDNFDRIFGKSSKISQKPKRLTASKK